MRRRYSVLANSQEVAQCNKASDGEGVKGGSRRGRHVHGVEDGGDEGRRHGAWDLGREVEWRPPRPASVRGACGRLPQAPAGYRLPNAS